MEPTKEKHEEQPQKKEGQRQDRQPYAPPALVRLGDMKNVTLNDGGGGGCGCGTGLIL